MGKYTDLVASLRALGLEETPAQLRAWDWLGQIAESADHPGSFIELFDAMTDSEQAELTAALQQACVEVKAEQVRRGAWN